jgi:hypothetical protein
VIAARRCVRSADLRTAQAIEADLALHLGLHGCADDRGPHAAEDAYGAMPRA